MKTQELIDLLARGEGVVESGVPARRLGLGAAMGLVGAGVLMAGAFGVRPDLMHGAMDDPMFWVKAAFAAGGALMALIAVSRLSRPGAKLASLPMAIAAPFIAIWILAALALINAAPGQRATLVFGETWLFCPFGIALLSVPFFVAMLWAMKGLAPTRLRLAGAGAGLVSGTLGALVYTLHCPEVAAPFIAVWYVLGILIPTVIGAAIGPRILRW
jgi:hypothetical protein